ncbi:hypothetical protein [Oceanirhabdus seepicola]|uniref:Uncharacterized protein n=1 Tax=Oceanirhabdus seepicola TaxID=2828781 RepID=A0A9J6P0A1_9CLOT|nr:hypothetical protein [Oceanirhabdus seepicola]MCM1989963.1 hypothetical protein [Oceanirhabdus seepicola]
MKFKKRGLRALKSIAMNIAPVIIIFIICFRIMVPVISNISHFVFFRVSDSYLTFRKYSLILDLEAIINVIICLLILRRIFNYSYIIKDDFIKLKNGIRHNKIQINDINEIRNNFNKEHNFDSYFLNIKNKYLLEVNEDYINKEERNLIEILNEQYNITINVNSENLNSNI